jgi:hypothetical protein
MTINYTTLLGLAEPVTGTESGTWGDDVNKGITDYLDIAIAGTQTISGSQTAVTLSVTNGSSAGSNIAQAGSGATGSSQYQIINCTGNPAGLLTITAPASSKTYVIINATSTSQSVKIVGSGPTTGVTLVSGEKALVAWNGSDFVKISTTASVSSFSAGSTGLTPSSSTTGAITLAGTLGTANGGTNLTSFTSGGAMYASSGSVLTTGTLPNTAGGTGQSSAFTQYGITYASTTTALATTAAGTTTTVLHGNASGAPTFGAVSLTADVSGTLPIANGGTGSSTLAGANIALTNTAQTFTATQTFNGTTATSAVKTLNIAEPANTVGSAPLATTNFYVNSGAVQYYTTNAANNWTLNIAFSSGTTLNTAMATNDSISITMLATQGSTAYYNSAVTIDGVSVTPKWQGGSAPTSGNASGIDSYTYVIYKTASATYTVLASQTKFA